MPQQDVKAAEEAQQLPIADENISLQITVTGDLQSEFLEWLDDTGHADFRRWLRETQEFKDSPDSALYADDGGHLKLHVDFIARAIAIVWKEPPLR